MGALPLDTLDNFEDLTRYPVKAYFRRYIDFIDNHKINIIDYYGGRVKVAPAKTLRLTCPLIKAGDLTNRTPFRVWSISARVTTPEMKDGGRAKTPPRRARLI